MRPDAILNLYRGASTLMGPMSALLLAYRRRRGKEDPQRLGERMGRPTVDHPGGSVAWVHGASVGESLALLPLIDMLVGRGLTVLVTTGTVTSATILETRLPPGAIHQYVPLDVPKFVRRFLDYWQPDLVLIAESELWPNILYDVHARGVPLILVNARLSARSFARWQKFPSAIASLLSRIDLCLAQSDDDALRLRTLGALRVQVTGNLKYDAPAPPVESSDLAVLTASIGRRPVWLAASTHDGEEEMAAFVHRQLNRRFPSLLTIIAPRHARRGPAIARLLDAQNLSYVLRSSGEPITRGTAVYVADTMGEMGLFYRLATIVFVGKSLAGRGGQNPIEPAKLGAAILHGPNVSNFRDVYATLDNAHGALMVSDADTLARALQLLLSDIGLMRKMARLASESVAQLGGATTHIMQAIEPYLLSMKLGRR